MGRELALGITAAVGALWLTFFAGPGSVEVATLITATVALIWFATVDPHRLVDERRRPHLLLFGLAALGGALLVMGAAVLSSGITFLTLAVGVAAVVVGMTRALRHGMQPPVPEE